MEFMRGLFMTARQALARLADQSHQRYLLQSSAGAQASTVFYIWKGVGPRTFT